MRMRIGAILAASALAFSTGAMAGEGNILRVLQTSPNGSFKGNSLSVDQSGASNSLVIGPNQSMIDALGRGRLGVRGLTRASDGPDRPALQRGEGNSATIVIEGNGGQLQLLQDNSNSGRSIGNSAVRAELDSGALGGVFQLGDSNNASLKVEALGTGLVAQNGNGNRADLTVGARGTGQIIQNGNRNSQQLTVNSNTTVTVTQNGNGLQPVGTAAIQVFSTNPGTISITQTGFR